MELKLPHDSLFQPSPPFPLPLRNFFNSMPFGSHSDPTLSQIRWQVFSSLAFGSKGVLYFCYWTPRGSEFLQGGGLLVPTLPESAASDGSDFIRGPHYEDARQVNSVIVAWEEHLLEAQSTCVWYLSAIAFGTNTTLPACDTDASVLPLVASVGNDFGRYVNGSVLVGQFDTGAVLLQNQDFTFKTLLTVDFLNAASSKGEEREGIFEVNRSTGEEELLGDDSPDAPGVQVSLDAGDARLFVVRSSSSLLSLRKSKA